MPEESGVPVPKIGDLFLDSARELVGEFRGMWGGKWALRPVKGGLEWEVDPKDARPLSPEQRLRTAVGQANARSRGDLL